MARYIDPSSTKLSGKQLKVFEALIDRVISTKNEVGVRWPYFADPETGQWTTTDDGDWCDGHWIEMLRIAGEISGDLTLVDEALIRTERSRWKLEKDDQFRGHRFYYSAARLAEYRDDTDMRTLALAAAYAMRSMAMKVNGGMPIGMECQVKDFPVHSRSIVAVDNMHPNLRLDWWAWRQTGDDVFKTGPRRQGELLLRDFVRADGSTYDFAEYDPNTGELLRRFSLFTKSEKGTWSRGQAWIIAGALLGFETFRDSFYLDLARKTFDYWWEKVGPAVPPYDFDYVGTDVPIDSSASAIVTAALARLAHSPEGPGAAGPLVARLSPMVEELLNRVTPISADDSRPPGMLLDGCFGALKKSGHRHELLWGDMYLMDTLYTIHRGKPFA